MAETTDRQQTNAALAALAKTGNACALGQLWEMNQRFINSQLWKWYTGHREACDAAAITYEDLLQEGFFAVQNAVAAYDPEKGAFVTYLDYHIRNAANRAVIGSQGRYVECSDGVTRRISANPLSDSIALDEPLPGADDTDATRMDMLEDPAAQAAFEAIDDESEADELRSGVNAALGRLDPCSAEVVRGRLMWSDSCDKVAQNLGITREQVRSLEAKAFRKLYRDKDIIRLHNLIIGQHIYSGTGFTSWKDKGSVQERALEHLEQRGALR